MAEAAQRQREEQERLQREQVERERLQREEDERQQQQNGEEEVVDEDEDEAHEEAMEQLERQAHQLQLQEKQMQDQKQQMERQERLIQQQTGMMRKILDRMDEEKTSPKTEPSTEEVISFQTPRRNVSSGSEWTRFNISFSGKSVDDDFDIFLDQFETRCELNNVPRTGYTTILKLYLKDLAAAYYRDIITKEGKNVNYSVLRESLRARLNASKSAEMTALEISSMKQGNGESVRNYYERFRKLVVSGTENSESSPFVLLHFRKGLKPSIKSNVLALSGKSLSEMLQAATSVEASLSMDETVSVNAASEVSDVSMTFTGKHQPGIKACYTCGSRFHIARFCNAATPLSDRGHYNRGRGSYNRGRGYNNEASSGGRGNSGYRGGNFRGRGFNNSGYRGRGNSVYNAGGYSNQGQQAYQHQPANPPEEMPEWFKQYLRHNQSNQNQQPAAAYASSGGPQQPQSTVKPETTEQVVDNCTLFESASIEIVVNDSVGVCMNEVMDRPTSDEEAEFELDEVVTVSEEVIVDMIEEAENVENVISDKEICATEVVVVNAMEFGDFENNQLARETVNEPEIEMSFETWCEDNVVDSDECSDVVDDTRETCFDFDFDFKLTINKDDNKPPDKPIPKPRRIKPPSLTKLLTLLLLLTMTPVVTPQAPMICRTGHSVARFTIPDLPPCILPDTGAIHEPVPLTLTIFKPNLIQYRTTAYHCKIVKTLITTHAGFFGENKRRTDDYLDQTVTKDSCISMFQWHKSEYGDMVQAGGVYRTNNEAKPEYHTGFKCCEDYEFTVYNAYLYETIILKRHGTKEKVESPAGVTSHCDYLAGFCNIRDGSALYWVPNNNEECKYLPHKTFEGELQGRTWLANNGELALTYTKSVKVKQNSECGGDVEISDQGMAAARVTSKIRVKRQTEGAVLESELNSKLQAIEIRIQRNYNHMFKSNVKSYCQVMQSIVRLIKVSLERHPTLAARHLLNQTYIHATLTHNLITVYPCQPVAHYTVRSSDVCSTRVPMNIIISGDNRTMFMDIHSNILYHDPNVDDCALDEEIPVVLEGSNYYYHHGTGSMTPIQATDQLNLIYLNYSATAISLDETVIHQLLLYDWDAFKNKFSLNDLTGSLYQQSNILKHLGVTSGFKTDPYTQAHTMASNVVNKGTFSFLEAYGEFNLKQVWIFVCCVYVTLNILCTCVRLCGNARNYRQNPGQRFREYFMGTSRHSQKSNDTNIDLSVNVNQNTDNTMGVRNSEETSITHLEERQMTNRPTAGISNQDISSGRTINIQEQSLAGIVVSDEMPSARQQNTNQMSSTAAMNVGRANQKPLTSAPLPKTSTTNPDANIRHIPSTSVVDVTQSLAVVPAAATTNAPMTRLSKIKQTRVSTPNTMTIGDALCNVATTIHQSLIQAWVNGHVYHVLIDSGAQISTVTKEFCSQLGISNKITSTTHSIRAVSGDIVKGIGSVYVTLRCKNIRQIQAKLLVIGDCHYPIILGVDNLRLMGKLCLDYSSGQLVMLPLARAKAITQPQNACANSVDAFKAENGEQFCNVFLDRDITLPPQSDNNLCVPGPKIPHQCVFEPTYVHPNIMFAKTLSPDHNVRCRVINYSDVFVTIYKGTPLGMIEELPKTRTYNVNANGTLTDLDDPIKKVDLTKSALSNADQSKFRKFLETKRAAFAKNSYDLGNLKGVSGTVCFTGDTRPIRQAPYRLPVAHKEPLDQEIDKMLKAKIIEPAPQSAWAAPVLLVAKKGGKKRIVNDFRKINACTDTLSFPLPHQDSIKEMLSGNALFSSLDLQSAFWQVALDSEYDRDRSTFVTYRGIYRYRVVPFGWKNSPQVFQRAMSKMLENLQWHTCQCFLDDILVFSKNDVDEHIARVGAVLDRFITHGIKINPEKSTWARSEVQYLGHTYNEQGSRPAVELVDKIHKFPSPSDLPSLRRALGMVNFYRSYIDSFSTIAKPLLQLLKKDEKFVWTEICENAFRILKSKLTKYPVLRYPDFTKKFHLHTDASGFALGAQLCQEFEDGLHPIAYYSRTLNNAEKNYSTYEKEGLAIVSACQHFRHFILGFPTVVVTDHSPLKWLMTCDHKSSRLAKFSLKLQEFDLTIIHKPGKENVVPDALSRVTKFDSCVVGVSPAHLSAAKQDLLTYKELQSTDTFLSQIIKYITNGTKPSDLTETQQRHWGRQKDNYILQEAVLYYNPPDSVRALLCVPKKLQFSLLDTYHCSLFSCHVGRNRTYKRLSTKYFWMGMSNDVREFISACILCNQRKRAYVNPIYPLQPIECERPFSRISMDILGPLPMTERGNRYLIAFQCSFTKLVIARPIPDRTTQTVTNTLIEYVILIHGCPTVLLSDNSAENTSDLIVNLAKTLHIDKRTCTPYMASTDGQIERFFSTFSNLISTVINNSQTDWDSLTKYVVHSYNNTEHSSTGFTPTYLAHGREIEIPHELCVPITMPKSYNDDKDSVQIMEESLAKAWAVTRDNIQGAQASYKYYHDLHVKGHEYEVGDIAYVYVPRVAVGQVKKFTRQFKGPYQITVLRGLNAYLRPLDSDGNATGVEFITHLQRLKKAKPPLVTGTIPTATYTSVKRPELPKTSDPNPQSTKPSHGYNLRNRN